MGADLNVDVRRVYDRMLAPGGEDASFSMVKFFGLEEDLLLETNLAPETRESLGQTATLAEAAMSGGWNEGAPCGGEAHASQVSRTGRAANQESDDGLLHRQPPSLSGENCTRAEREPAACSPGGTVWFVPSPELGARRQSDRPASAGRVSCLDSRAFARCSDLYDRYLQALEEILGRKAGPEWSRPPAAFDEIRARARCHLGMNCHTVESLDGESREAALIRAIQERAQAMRREQHVQAVKAVQSARFALAMMREISEARLRAQEEAESRHRAAGTGSRPDNTVPPRNDTTFGGPTPF